MDYELIAEIVACSEILQTLLLGTMLFTVLDTVGRLVDKNE